MILNLKKFASDNGLYFYNHAGVDTNSDVSIPLIDSRSLLFPEKTVFFALRTPSNDGHRYVRDLYRAGVRNFVVHEIPETLLYSDANFIVADSVTDVLHRSAMYARSQVSCPVVGITGSRGKTVVKEMLAVAVAPEHNVAKSPRSWNSQIGVPQSLWRLGADTTLGIFEAGISQSGEMESLEIMIRPDIGVFTSLTSEHERGFSSISEKCREKAILFRNCPVVVYPAGEELIEATLRLVCPASRLVAATGGNAGLVREVMRLAGYDDALIDERLSGLSEVSTRIDIIDGVENNNIAYDFYTNDIDGVETAIDIVARRLAPGKPLILVIGDLQYGHRDPVAAYSELERLLLARNVDGFVGVGEEISRYAAGFSPLLKKSFSSDPEHFNRWFNTYNFPDAAVLVKGRPGAGFDRIRKWLEFTRHETSLEVNLDSLIHNYNYYRSLIRPETGLVAMVKADAYGAGAVEVAKTLQSQGADYLAVAVVEEGMKLREAGISMPIMVLNPISSNRYAMFEKNLEPTVFSVQELKHLDCFAPVDTEDYPIHIKLDTGMHRFGFTEDELPGLVAELKKYPKFKVVSIFSHLSTADCLDQDEYTESQLEKFERMSSFIMGHLSYKVKRHILNTAGIMRYARAQYDMVRLGIGLYGVSPDEAIGHESLRPVSRLVTRISAVHRREPGDTIGYGRRGVITRPSLIATLPVGYADGIDRHLGNGRASFIVNGVACPTVGNICMDICMIDITDAGNQCGAEVEVFGNSMPVTKVAEVLDTIPYEVLTSVSPRVKRVYYRE